MCYVSELQLAANRSDYCQRLDGGLLEVHTQEDFTMLVHIIKRLITSKKISNTTIIAVGAEVVMDDNSSVLVWKGSRSLVDYSRYGMVKPASASVQIAGDVLFLKPMNYNLTGFSFDLNGFLQADVAAAFVCMKAGKFSLEYLPKLHPYKSSKSIFFYYMIKKTILIMAGII